MRIAQVAPCYYPYIGGVEKVVQKISEEMVKEGHLVDVLTADSTQKDAKLLLNGVVIKRFPPSGPYHYSRMLYKYLKENGNIYDIIHAHSFHTLLPLLCVKALENGRDFKLVLMGHYHGQGRTPFTSFLLQISRPVFAKVYKKAALVLFLTEYEKRLLRNHFHLDEYKTKLISNGVAIEEIKAAEPYCDLWRTLLIVSRLEKYKNIHIGIKAMSYLSDEYRLVIIGEGPYRPELEKLANKLGLIKRVIFINRLQNEEVFRWYKTCDLVLNLSSLESFGLTVIEGLAAAKPVLVNNRTALAELARRFEGVTAVDAEKMTSQELGAAIEKRINTQFSTPDLHEYRWNIIAERLIDYYQMIL